MGHVGRPIGMNGAWGDQSEVNGARRRVGIEGIKGIGGIGDRAHVNSQNGKSPN